MKYMIVTFKSRRTGMEIKFHIPDKDRFCPNEGDIKVWTAENGQTDKELQVELYSSDDRKENPTCHR